MTDPPQRPNETDDPASETRSRQLHTLFEDVTGTTELVTEQESSAASRDVHAAATTLSEYVQNAMSDDGLTDTIDDPEMGPE